MYRWLLGDFSTGSITRPQALPAIFGSENVKIDILGTGSADLSISLLDLTQAERNSWRETFAQVRNFVALEDDSQEWQNALLFAGYIDRVSVDIASGELRIKILEISEYLKNRLVIDKWASLQNPSTSIIFRGNSWGDVLVSALNSAFSSVGVPSGAPKPPQILGTIPAYNTGPLSKEVVLTDAKTYHSLLTEIKEESSLRGFEWRLNPRWKSSQRSAVVWDIQVGSNAEPHINENTTINLALAENSAKFSSYSLDLDSREIFSKLYIQSKKGEGDAGADLTPSSVSSSDFPLLVERFYSPGVELTADELSAQLNARMGYALEPSVDLAFSVEEQWSPNLWRSRIGNTLQITGVPDSISAGHSTTVRCVGINFTPGQGTVKVDVMAPQPSYPRLPSRGIDDLISAKSINSSSLNSFGGGSSGSIPPWNPGSGDAGDGGLGIEWGSGGSDPGVEPPAFDPAAEWDLSNYGQKGALSGSWVYISQNQGNVLFFGPSIGNSLSYGSAEFPTGFAVGEGDIYSGYLSNGTVEGFASRRRLVIDGPMCQAILDMAQNNGAGRPAKGLATNVEYKPSSATVTTAGIFSVGSYVYVPVDCTISWARSGSPTLKSTVTVFLRAAYNSYANIVNFTLDPISALRKPRDYARNAWLRAGSWIVCVSDRSTISAANFASGSADLNIWHAFPSLEKIAPNSGTGSLAVAKAPDGNGRALYYNLRSENDTSAYWIRLQDAPIPAEGENWQEIPISEEISSFYTLGTIEGAPVFIAPTSLALRNHIFSLKDGLLLDNGATGALVARADHPGFSYGPYVYVIDTSTYPYVSFMMTRKTV